MLATCKLVNAEAVELLYCKKTIYEFEDDELKHVQMTNSHIARMWPGVLTSPKDYNGFNDAMATMNSLQVTVYVESAAAWASRISLRCWISIQQQFTTLQRSGRWQDLGRRHYRAFSDVIQTELRKEIEDTKLI